MSIPPFEVLYPRSPAFLELPPMRIPPEWKIGWNDLSGMAAGLGGIGGSTVFQAKNEERRFDIDPLQTFRPTAARDGSPSLEEERKRSCSDWQ